LEEAVDLSSDRLLMMMTGCGPVVCLTDYCFPAVEILYPDHPVIRQSYLGRLLAFVSFPNVKF
jgi:hypothetical protein